MSNPLYKLEINKDYAVLPILCKTDVYTMQAFVDNGFKHADLRSLNFVRNYIYKPSL